ncbi:hypothetical protein HDV03_003412 [Kappamyces sp. JEL0829]|nr:hypothetical protein HDV03_003412 [Kappamyces sp. JEL0829]
MKVAMVISGPSGSGKSTLLNRLFARFPSSFGFSVSHCTRLPRKGEVEGVAYNFVSREEFERLREQGGFIETAEFSGNLYGTSIKAVEKVQSLDKICVLDLEAKGVQSIKQKDLPAKFIFIQPPSIQELEARLTARGTETPESLAKRLASAQEAFDLAAQQGVYDLIVVNDDVDTAYANFEEFVVSTWGL